MSTSTLVEYSIAPLSSPGGTGWDTRSPRNLALPEALQDTCHTRRQRRCARNRPPSRPLSARSITLGGPGESPLITHQPPVSSHPPDALRVACSYIPRRTSGLAACGASCEKNVAPLAAQPTRARHAPPPVAGSADGRCCTPLFGSRRGILRTVCPAARGLPIPRSS